MNKIIIIFIFYFTIMDAKTCFIVMIYNNLYYRTNIERAIFRISKEKDIFLGKQYMEHLKISVLASY